MRGKGIYLFLGVAVTLSGCVSKRTLPPAPIGTAGDTTAGAEGEGGFADGTDAASKMLQRDLSIAAGSDRVLFALDAHTLSATAQQTLARQVAWLRQHPEVSFTIEGHCDERGTREYNLALGDRRAKAAADYIVAQGISIARIRTISYGKERPEALGSDEESYGQNRRAISIVVRAN